MHVTLVVVVVGGVGVGGGVLVVVLALVLRPHTSASASLTWQLMHGRADQHICDMVDANFALGVRRPAADGTCAAAGGCEGPPQNTSVGRLCYCDAACVERLDCCNDYASVCAAPPTSCVSDCDTTLARAIPGGGYCWCSTCDAYDPRGAEHCCPDQQQACGYTPEPEHICLDARAHLSAVGLFLAEHRLQSLLAPGAAA